MDAPQEGPVIEPTSIPANLNNSDNYMEWGDKLPKDMPDGLRRFLVLKHLACARALAGCTPEEIIRFHEEWVNRTLRPYLRQ